LYAAIQIQHKEELEAKKSAVREKENTVTNLKIQRG
jgi:hypothetical protein